MQNKHLLFTKPGSNKAFTLLELLVVIAIIGIISSIASISYAASREKAIIARHLLFSTSIEHSNEKIAEWNFNDVNDLGKDSGDGQYDGTNIGGFSTSDSIEGSAFDAGDMNGYIEIQDTTPSGLGPGNNSIIIEAFIKPLYNNQPFGIIGKASYNLYYNPVSWAGACVQCLSFRIDGVGSAYGYAYLSAPVNMTPNKWHHIVAIYDGVNSRIKVIFDGKEVVPTSSGLPAIKYPIVDEDYELYIGYNPYYSGEQFPGLIDRVRIYRTALGI